MSLFLSIKLVRVPISSAQLLGIHTAPVIAVYPPGAGKVIQILNTFYDYHHGGVSYTGPCDTHCYYHGTTVPADIAAHPFLQTSNAVSFGTGLSDSINTRVSLENIGIDIKSPTANYMAGNGKAMVTIYYAETILM